MDTPTSTSYTPAPVPMTPPVTPAPHHRSPVVPILIGVVVLALLIVGANAAGIWPFSKSDTAMVSPSPSVSASPTVDPTAGWKTYTNTQYEFEYKYPPEMVLGGVENVEIPSKLFTFWIDFREPGKDILFARYPVNAEDSLANYRNKWELVPMTLGSNTWYRMVVHSDGDHIQYFTEMSGNLYRVSVFQPENENVAKQIISTFKFIEKSTLESVDATWNLYTSHRLGFSMKVSKSTYQAAEVIVKEEGDIVSIGTEAEVASLNNTTWRIRVGAVDSTDALALFIAKTPAWANCQIETITPVAATNYRSVVLKGTLPEGGCFVNYNYAILYSPELKKAASWSIGQACGFSVSANQSQCRDEEMTESFRFLNE